MAELVDNSMDARLDVTEHTDALLDYKQGRIAVSDDWSGWTRAASLAGIPGKR